MKHLTELKERIRDHYHQCLHYTDAGDTDMDNAIDNSMLLSGNEAQTVLELIERFEKIERLTEQLNADSDTDKYIRKMSDISQKDLNEPMTI